ncbi:MAG: DEAD/DEAH box helicase [Chloroflexi bacterium]|nr:DEAD/DEAH box helicase [Chloroflexota bacterium]
MNPISNPLNELLNHWQTDPALRDNLIHRHVQPAASAQWTDFPEDVNPKLIAALEKMGFPRLFSHQKTAWDFIQQGMNVVITTGTASGKTLAYNLPVLDRFLEDDNSCVLYLFPTKALAQDQEHSLRSFLMALDERRGIEKYPGLYDGDTPQEKRRSIRREARFVFTNPDMLHRGILPFHTSWERFFSNLRFVIIDEIHTYRGVFGSHVANVIRRLKRIARFYGSNPQFIMTSATIANPQEFSEKLVEEDVKLISTDGSPHGKRNFVLYNPPIVQEELGIRRNPMVETVRLCDDLLASHIQTLIFARSRKLVEFTLKNLQQYYPEQSDNILSYRSGYLPLERRQIEKRIKEGTARVVVATNALELGIDIGGLDAIMMMGYPGSISGFRQQAGRAGRKERESLVVMVASSTPLDQFLLQHADYLFASPVEHALIQPDNLIILFQHIRCAVFELPFEKNENFGNLDPKIFTELLEVLKMAENVHFSGDKYYWVSAQYPAGEISLRTAGDRTFLLQDETDGKLHNIGVIDEPSAYWMVHPQAVYFHAGQSYLVKEMDFEHAGVKLVQTSDDYYTEPKQKMSVERMKSLVQDTLPIGEKTFGEIKVRSQVTGYKKIDFNHGEVLSTHELEMPETQLITTGTWLAIDDKIIDKLREMQLWNDDRNYYGANWNEQRLKVMNRDGYTCQVCGRTDTGANLHVHHKIPFKNFTSSLEANNLNNLITLCSNCHRKAETVVRVKSGLGGLGYTFHHLAPLLLMCDYLDIGIFTDPNATITDGKPCVLLYDQVPAGIGLSESIFKNFHILIENAYELVSHCQCKVGCPSCVGAPGEHGTGAKVYTRELLQLMRN